MLMCALAGLGTAGTHCRRFFFVSRYEKGQHYHTHHDYFEPTQYSKSARTLEMTEYGASNRLATVFWCVVCEPALPDVVQCGPRESLLRAPTSNVLVITRTLLLRQQVFEHGSRRWRNQLPPCWRRSKTHTLG